MSFEFLISTPFVVLYCAVITVFFGWALRRLHLETAKLGRHFTSVLKLKNLPTDSGERLDKLSETMKGWADSPWSELRATLDQRGGSIRSPHAAALYFNSGTVIENRDVFVSSRSVPNLLTGIGILGTFIGLAAGVGVAHDDLSGGNSADIQSALEELLSGASLAFLTSIFGIAGSIAFTWVAGRWLSRLKDAIDTMAESLDGHFDRTTVDRIAREDMEGLTKVVEHVRDGIKDGVAGQLQTLTTAIAGKERTGKSWLETALGELERGGDRLQTLATAVAGDEPGKSRIEVALDELERISSGITRFNTDLVFALEEALGWGRGAVERAQAATGTLPALSGAIAEDLSPKFKSISDEVTRLRYDRQADAGELITNALADFRNTMQEQTGSQFSEMAGVLDTLNQTLTESTDKLARSQRSIAESMNHDVADMTRRLEQAARALGASMADSSNAAGKTLESAVESASQELTRAGDQAASSIAASTRPLREAAEQLSAASLRNRDVFDRTTQFVERLNQLRGTIEATHAGISRVADPIRVAAEHVRVATDRSTNALVKAGDVAGRVSDSVGELEQHQNRVTETWASYEERFDGVDQSLQRVFEQINEGLSAYCDQVARFVKELDDRTARTVQHLAAATRELSEAIEDLTEDSGATRGRPGWRGRGGQS